MKNTLELVNLEKYEFCILDKTTGEVDYYTEPKQSGYRGIYFWDERTFFALYPTKEGPAVWYKGKEYPITRDLTIVVTRDGKNRNFSIKEYGISIDYLERECIAFDIWSGGIDLDPFFRLEQRYKADDFYENHTKDISGE